MIKLSTLTVLPQNETRTIRCEVAGAQYFLWNFPNGDFLQTAVPTVSSQIHNELISNDRIFQISINLNTIGRYGTIKCSAGNNYGAVTVGIEIVESNEKPSIVKPSYRNVTAIGGKTVMIPCEANRRAQISWLLPSFNTLHR